jgi:predicted DNA-binding protein
MSVRTDVSRMTIDIPKKSHKQLKALSVVLGKSMREIVIESIEDYLHSVKLPNKETLKAIEAVENGTDLAKAKNLEDLFKKLGI